MSDVIPFKFSSNPKSCPKAYVPNYSTRQIVQVSNKNLEVQSLFKTCLIRQINNEESFVDVMRELQSGPSPTRQWPGLAAESDQAMAWTSHCIGARLGRMHMDVVRSAQSSPEASPTWEPTE